MKVTVFGGSGFLGSHVADALTAAGHMVTLFDIRASAYRLPSQREIVGDILDTAAVETAVAGQDVVYNFAGIADIDEAKDRPLDTVRYNILGNTVLLDAARKHGIGRFVFASTLYVYSEAGSFYRASKQACERIIEAYANIFGLEYTILRYGSLYGPRADQRNGIYRLLFQAVTENRITYKGTGEEQREFIHVQDAAHLSVQAMGQEFRNEHLVLTGHQAMKFRDLMVMVNEMMGNRLELVFDPATSGEHYCITPYAFSPKVGRKLVRNKFIDMGQGLLKALEEVYRKEKHPKEIGGWVVDDEDKSGISRF